MAASSIEDVFMTDLDGDLPPIAGQKETASEEGRYMAASSAAAASINAEWRRLQSRDARHDEEAKLSAAHSNADSEAVVRAQPRRFSEADVILQPSQVEEMLGQNSLLLGISHTQGQKSTGEELNSTSSNSLQIGGATSASTPAPTSSSRSSLWSGIMACFNPLVGARKKEKRLSEKMDDWEVPFADIRELDFIGSGSQGAVFVGEYLGEKVAVKKVKDVTYCAEAKHLRKLRHPNIVRFK